MHNIYSINWTDAPKHNSPHSAGNDVHSDFDPLGEKITFRSNRTGAIEAFAMNFDGSDQQQQTFHGLSARHPSFSPDGREFIFHRVARPRCSALALVPAIGRGVTYLISFAGAHVNAVWVSASPQ